ncbi:MAG: zinc ribbon domain-containing protein [bacterium]
MPIYVYEVEGGECDKYGCTGQFEMLEPIRREPMATCPRCHKCVHRVPSVAHGQMRTADPLGALAKAGFHGFVRDDDGTLVDKYSGKKIDEVLKDTARKEGVDGDGHQH